ncbi:hypothetical protein A2634_00325 [Candidatus Amesbacteria bacterium RIFCSPHIGHO2_01_FULL_48_32]|uniref:AI-2E family transporter n=1 Tax=Candidatus Amesbacteria bacterium RIFCSPLOWO2_01_FULL_48_25 TaxID=1797259 RepID=A0A1F4ZCW1_9BACT|nr:MAG: hypothetical protein A2634_00325 [Candidatus Amesbacteria bacterium RIFCSPHIGHO2_01_FULL_48_32]OGD03254.1 MAG: hypothetical protein A2989_00275 [Candidatus Amesbacteria bacterium RIFCSPLOWO2_01_FULL_48_25]HJZ05201.1 AI-2E family transporter [Patescibacteria group bacterium]
MISSKIEISSKTIVFIALFIFLIWFTFQITDILIMLFVSVILTAAMGPLVDRLEKLRLPRPLAIVLVYIVVWGIVGSLIASLIPSLVDQTRRLIQILPAAVNRIEFFNTHQQEIAQQFLSRVGELPQNLLRLVFNLFGNLLNVLTVLVMSFYLLLERGRQEKYVSHFAGPESAPRVNRVIEEVESRLGAWVRGEVVLMFAVGLLTYIGLVFLGLDIALPLAILAGFLEIIPNVGPIISSVPSVLVALTVNPLIAAATASWYFLVQFLENNFLVPKVMQKAVGVNPLISLLGLMVGLRLGGPVGAVLALPIIITIRTCLKEFFPTLLTPTS